MITDPRYNELRGALLNLEKAVEATDVDDPAFLGLLRVYQDTSEAFLRYSNREFDEMATRLKEVATNLEDTMVDLKNKGLDTNTLNAILGIGKAIAGVAVTGGYGGALTAFLG